MNSEEEQPLRRPLKPHQAALIVVMMSCFVLLLVTGSLHEFLASKRFFGSLFGFVAFLWLLITLIYFHLYRQVKKGTKVVLRSPSLTSPRIPFLIGFAVTCLLTLLVAGVSYFCYFDLYRVFKTLNQRLIMTGFNLFFWLLTSFAWYRLLSEKPLANPVRISEQTEGVWPPAPRVAIEEDNKD